jgi:hypothetical protein
MQPVAFSANSLGNVIELSEAIANRETRVWSRIYCGFGYRPDRGRFYQQPVVIVSSNLFFAEPGVEQRFQSAERFLSVTALGSSLELGTLPGPKHHEASNTARVDLLRTVGQCHRRTELP